MSEKERYMCYAKCINRNNRHEKQKKNADSVIAKLKEMKKEIK